jgi:hypothetical protein
MPKTVVEKSERLGISGAGFSKVQCSPPSPFRSGSKGFIFAGCFSRQR